MIPRLEGYKILEDKLLGVGSQGRVFECVSLNGDQKEKLCIKIMNGSNDKNCQREFANLELLYKGEILNPNLVSVKAAGYDQTQRLMYIIMEKCESSLEQEWQQKKKYSEFEILDGYRPFYDNKILHRDLKPENILINYINLSPQYKLTDFGVGINYQENSINTIGIGTPVYQAPEVNPLNQNIVLCKQDLDNMQDKSAIDVYSIGIILYQLLFGEYPFPANQFGIIEFFNKLEGNNQIVMKKIPNNYSEIYQIVQAMILYKPSQRITFQQLYQHFGKIKISSQPSLNQNADKSKLNTPIFMQSIQSNEQFKNLTAERITNSLNHFQNGLPNNGFNSKKPVFPISTINKDSFHQKQLLSNQSQISIVSTNLSEQYCIWNQYKPLSILQKQLEFFIENQTFLKPEVISLIKMCLQSLYKQDDNQIGTTLKQLLSYYPYDHQKQYSKRQIKFQFSLTYLANQKHIPSQYLNTIKEDQMKVYMQQWFKDL